MFTNCRGILLIFLILCGVFFKSSQCEIYRLPNDTYPTHYDIYISTKLDRGDFQFRGEVKIAIEAGKDTYEVILNAKSTTVIDKVRLLRPDNQYEENVEIPSLNPRNEQLTVKFREKLIRGKNYTLTLEYHSELAENKLGFYRSSYINDQGEQVWLAATQFAPTEARHAFPCYDEPNFKATFSVYINHPTELEAISNTQKIDSNIELDRTRTTSFGITPKMSTYLVGWVISDFGRSDKSSNNNPMQNQTFYVRKNALKMITFAETYGFDVLQYFRKYFKPDPYLGLIQQVALPDVHFNGMENWGMVTYRESRLFYDSELNSDTARVNIAILMSHEMAHQWFGNLITMKWWTYVWIKEGFSSLYEYYGPDMLYPEWNIMEQFIIKKLHSVFLVDSDIDIRPMSFYVEIQKDIMENYDRIAYDKSACVLRMIDHAFSTNIFHLAVNTFLEKWGYKNVEETDLFNAIEEMLSNSELNKELNVSKALLSWTRQQGYPLVTVRRKYNETSFTVTQERFVADGTKRNTTWWIPYNFATGSSPNFNDTTPFGWMSTETLEVKEDSTQNEPWRSDDWIVMNVQQTGFYRVNYDDKNWELISKALQKDYSIIHVFNRAQLIDDAFNLAFSGRLNITVALELIWYMDKERAYAPWAALENAISVLRRYLSEYAEYHHFELYLQKIINPVFKQFGVNDVIGDALSDKYTRQIVAKIACEVGLKDCLNSDLDYNHKNMRSVYYCNQMRMPHSNIIIRMKNELKTITDQMIRSEIISSIGCAVNDVQITVFLILSLQKPSEINLTVDERISLIQSIYGKSQKGFDLTLQLLDLEWEIFKQNIPDDKKKAIMLDLPKYVYSVGTYDQLMKLVKSSNNFLTRVDQKKIEKNVIQSLLWVSRNKEFLDRFFNLDLQKGFAVTFRYNLWIMILCLSVYFIM